MNDEILYLQNFEIDKAQNMCLTNFNSSVHRFSYNNTITLAIAENLEIFLFKNSYFFTRNLKIIVNFGKLPENLTMKIILRNIL